MHMSTVHLPFRALFCLLLASCLAFPAKAAPLKPFKDELFSYGTVLETADGGDYRVVDYQELREAVRALKGSLLRQEIYADETAPLIEVYRGRDLLIEVDGLGEIDEVSSRIAAGLAERGLGPTD